MSRSAFIDVFWLSKTWVDLSPGRDVVVEHCVDLADVVAGELQMLRNADRDANCCIYNK